MNRSIWIPKMTPSRLERLLAKPVLSSNDKEDLLDFKYFMLNDEQGALDKGLLVELLVSQKGRATTPKKLFWLTNIEEKTSSFNSKYYID